MYNVIINMVMLQISKKFLILKRYQKEINILKQGQEIHQVQELLEKSNMLEGTGIICKLNTFVTRIMLTKNEKNL